VDKFDTSVALLISAIVGAGVFALPVLARDVGLLSVFVIAAAFAYMLGLGYLVVELTPGTVEEEVERTLGTPARKALVAVETAVVLMALVAYVTGLNTHLGASELIVFSLVAIPLVMELHFPANFTQFLAFFILLFISILSLTTIPRMELPVQIFLRSTALSEPAAAVGIDLFAVVPLFLAAAFAFYGHNMVPRIRNILRNKDTTRRAFYMALAIVFLLYLPFAVSVSGVGVEGLATSYLKSFFQEPMSSIVDLFSVVIFYTSFIIFGLHAVGEFADRRQGTALVLIGTFLLYFIASFLAAPFEMLVAAAGLGVTIYAFFAALAGVMSKKLYPVPQAILGTTLLVWLALILQLF
jgi:tyrosine-specific transport protein